MQSLKLLAATALISLTTASTDQSSPSGSHDVYGVSQNQHRKLHPLARTNTLGMPVSKPSP